MMEARAHNCILVLGLDFLENSPTFFNSSVLWSWQIGGAQKTTAPGYARADIISCSQHTFIYSSGMASEFSAQIYSQ